MKKIFLLSLFFSFFITPQDFYATRVSLEPIETSMPISWNFSLAVDLAVLQKTIGIQNTFSTFALLDKSIILGVGIGVLYNHPVSYYEELEDPMFVHFGIIGGYRFNINSWFSIDLQSLLGYGMTGYYKRISQDNRVSQTASHFVLAPELVFNFKPMDTFSIGVSLKWMYLSGFSPMVNYDAWKGDGLTLSISLRFNTKDYYYFEK